MRQPLQIHPHVFLHPVLVVLSMRLIVDITQPISDPRCQFADIRFAQHVLVVFSGNPNDLDVLRVQ